MTTAVVLSPMVDSALNINLLILVNLNHFVLFEEVIMKKKN
jgi:hypothetical protein